MEEKKKKNYFNIIASRIFIILLVGYIVIYIAGENGYYDAYKYKETEMTNSKIEQFEKDVKSGKSIKVSDYINEKDVSYQNIISTAGITLSDGIVKVISDGLGSTFNFLGELFNG